MPQIVKTGLPVHFALPIAHNYALPCLAIPWLLAGPATTFEPARCLGSAFCSPYFCSTRCVRWSVQQSVAEWSNLARVETQYSQRFLRERKNNMSLQCLYKSTILSILHILIAVCRFDPFYRAACNADAVLWWEFCLSVRLSVTSVNCDKTVERSVQMYIPYER